MSARQCLFCDRTLDGKRAKEHVIADWLLEHLRIGHDTVELFLAETETEQIVKKRSHAADCMLEGRTCDECNNGWMSNLETQVKPLLIPLIDGTQSAFAIAESHRLLIARWVSKTAYALNSSSVHQLNIDTRHLRSLASGLNQPFERVAVFIQQYQDSREFSFVQENHWPIISVSYQPECKQSFHNGGYKIGLQFRKVFFSVAFWPHQNWRYVVGAGMHIPLWPVDEYWFAYSIKEQLPLDDSYKTLRTFNSSLAVTEIPNPNQPGAADR
jgi:hypothetical protein